MVKRLSIGVLIAALLAISMPNPATAQANACAGLTRSGVPFATERITVAGTAVGLTAATFKPGSDSREWARYAFFSNETDEIRFLVDGSTPTASIGHLVPVGAYVTVCGITSLQNFKAIRVTTSATIQVTYFK